MSLVSQAKRFHETLSQEGPEKADVITILMDFSKKKTISLMSRSGNFSKIIFFPVWKTQFFPGNRFKVASKLPESAAPPIFGPIVKVPPGLFYTFAAELFPDFGNILHSQKWAYIRF